MRHFQIICVLLFFSFLISISFASEEKIDLKASIDLALKQNPGLISLQKKLEASEQSARQVASSFLPSLTLEAGYGESYSQPYDVSLNVGGGTTTFSTLPNNPFWGSNYAFTLKQPIYMGGKMVNNLEIAKQGIIAAREELRRNEQDLIYKIVESYLNILKLKKLQNVQENKLIYAQESLGKIEKMKEVGMAIDSNVLAAEILKISSEQELKKTKNNLSVAQDFFLSLLGKEENSVFDLFETVNSTKHSFLSY
jgi:outer membrane protein TolC